MSENQNLRQVWLALGTISRLFRLNSGMGWVPTAGKVYRLPNGDIVVPGGRAIPLGLGDPAGKAASGFGDLLGWTTITITQAMVGTQVAIFTDIEVKSSADAKKRQAQHDAIDLVRRSGGIAGFAHTPDMAIEIVTRFTSIRHKLE